MSYSVHYLLCFHGVLIGNYINRISKWINFEIDAYVSLGLQHCNIYENSILIFFIRGCGFFIMVVFVQTAWIGYSVCFLFIGILYECFLWSIISVTMRMVKLFLQGFFFGAYVRTFFILIGYICYNIGF